jgi:hypothetical protein
LASKLAKARPQNIDIASLILSPFFRSILKNSLPHPPFFRFSFGVFLSLWLLGGVSWLFGVDSWIFDPISWLFAFVYGFSAKEAIWRESMRSRL